MKIVTDSTNRFGNNVKPIIQKCIYPKGYEKAVLIFGTQRSGTTLLSYLLAQFNYARAFGEFSTLSNMDKNHGIRLNPINDVKEQLSNVHSPIIIMKPLVESQRAKHLLEQIDNSYSIWQYRHYSEVASSDNLKFKGTSGMGNIEPFLDAKNMNWRSENSSQFTRDTISSIMKSTLSNYECACLFWWARNQLFFEQSLENHERVKLVNYRNFVNLPIQTTINIFDYIDYEVPEFMNVTKVGKNKKMRSEQAINPTIKELCDEMYSRLCQSSSNLI